jgi:hypothetical protein
MVPCSGPAASRLILVAEGSLPDGLPVGDKAIPVEDNNLEIKSVRAVYMFVYTGASNGLHTIKITPSPV